ncbi:MAG: UDP-N-acetylglucosamine 1-carboxyvinyltransferase, partial [Planctomycetota bacterium]|nr:UDP-N-acetylglucosamine 1-carboxyvinyltransferase [Planctomycetota bacterium]
VIEHAACEPEVEDLARFLRKMGARIQGAGSHRIVINGVPRLQGCRHDVIPDRIEAGTWIAAAAATCGKIWIRNCRPEHMAAVISCFRDAGVSVATRGDGIEAAMDGRPRELEATMLPYPGFPTDMQPQLMTVLTMADGASVITDAIYPDRFMHAAELCRLGARIRRIGSTAVIVGRPRLQGAPVMASDLRAAAALIIAGLAAGGETQVRRIYHADRGYESLDEKLKALGADVRREEDSVEPMPKPPADLTMSQVQAPVGVAAAAM